MTRREIKNQLKLSDKWIEENTRVWDALEAMQKMSKDFDAPVGKRVFKDQVKKFLETFK